MENSRMGYLADIIKSIWEDGPIGQPTQPSKPRIRTELAPALEAAVDGAAAGLVLAWDWAELQTKVGTRNGQPGRVDGPDAGTHADTVLGGTVANRGNYSWYAPTSKWRWISALENLSADVDALEVAQAAETAARIAGDAKIPNVQRQRAIRRRPVAGRPRRQKYFDSVYGPVDYKKWLVGVTVPREVNPGAWGMWMFSAGATEIGLRIIKRPGAVGNGTGTTDLLFPGLHSSDVLLQPLTWHPIGNVMPTPLIDGQYQHASIPINEGVERYAPNYIYFHIVYARNAAGAYQAIAVARGRDRGSDANDPAWKVGSYSADPSDGAGGFVTPQMVGCALYEALYVEGQAESFIGADANSSKVAIDGPVKLNQSETVSGAWNVRLPVASLDVQPAPIFDENNGEMTAGLAKAAANRSHYSVLTLSPDTGSLLSVAGPDRQFDPNMYIPATTGFAPVANVLVHSTGVEMIMTSQFDRFVRRGHEGEHYHWLAKNRYFVRKTLSKLRSGLPVRYAGYGDSITSITAGVVSSEYYYAPNGPNRDVIGYLTNYPADTRSLIPRYDGDGGVGAHVHIGMDWSVKEAMEGIAGSLVEYLNMGIGGTKTDNSVNGDGTPNGRYPARLAALSALEPDFVNIRFGMNEILSQDYYGNMRALIQTVRALPSKPDVMVTTCPRPGPNQGMLADWLMFNTEYARRACEAEQCAFVDLSRISGPGNEGAIGISARTMCDVDNGPHPGVYELGPKGYGGYSALTFQL